MCGLAEHLRQPRFCGKPLGCVVVADFAIEAVDYLGLLNRSAVDTIVEMMIDHGHEHPRTTTTAFRKLGEQLPVEEKKRLGLRANAFMSKQAFSQLTDVGKKRPIEAHQDTLLRATFNRTKVMTLLDCEQHGYEEVRFSPSHLDECTYCQTNDEKLIAIAKLPDLPFAECRRDACSVFLLPYKDDFAGLS